MPHLIAIFLIALLLPSTMALAQKPASLPKDEYGAAIKSHSESVITLKSEIATYLKSETCDDNFAQIKNLLSVYTYISSRIRYLDPNPRKPASQVQFEQNLINEMGRLYIDLGQAALDKKCPSQARTSFLIVIDEFTEPYHAALRERARIGIDDARAMQNR